MLVLISQSPAVLPLTCRRLLGVISILLALFSAHSAAAAAGVAPVPNDRQAVFEQKRYSIDPLRSFITFSIGFMKIRSTEGAFHDYSGTIMFSDKNIDQSTVTVVIEAESIYTGVMARDRHLRSSDFFEVAKYPFIVFQSRSIQRQAGGWKMAGDLSMHGTTRRLQIDVRREELMQGAGGTRLSFSGETQLKRRDFGVIGNFWGDKVLADRVDVKLHIEATEAERGVFQAPMHGKKRLSRALLPRVREEGVEVLQKEYDRLRSEQPEDYDFSAFALLQLALDLKRIGRVAEATEVVGFNLKRFPEHTTTWDLLGYLQAMAGDRQGSMATYRQLLKLAPGHSGALEMLRHLSYSTTVSGR